MQSLVMKKAACDNNEDHKRNNNNNTNPPVENPAESRPTDRLFLSAF